MYINMCAYVYKYIIQLKTCKHQQFLWSFGCVMSKVDLWQASRGGTAFSGMAFSGRKNADQTCTRWVLLWFDPSGFGEREQLQLIKLIKLYAIKGLDLPGKMIWLDFQRFSVRICEVVNRREVLSLVVIRHHLEPPETSRQVGMWCRIFMAPAYHWFTDSYIPECARCSPVTFNPGSAESARLRYRDH